MSKRSAGHKSLNRIKEWLAELFGWLICVEGAIVIGVCLIMRFTIAERTLLHVLAVIIIGEVIYYIGAKIRAKMGWKPSGIKRDDTR